MDGDTHGSNSQRRSVSQCSWSSTTHCCILVLKNTFVLLRVIGWLFPPFPHCNVVRNPANQTHQRRCAVEWLPGGGGLPLWMPCAFLSVDEGAAIHHQPFNMPMNKGLGIRWSFLDLGPRNSDATELASPWHNNTEHRPNRNPTSGMDSRIFHQFTCPHTTQLPTLIYIPT